MFVAGLFAGAAHAAGITPDGNTATTVAVAPGGRATVGIAAPVANGISHNTFTHFNVGRAGADFQNAGVNARYIVAEVTSLHRSVLEGPVGVLGPRANLIIANPNGITANGVTFSNVGSLALTTGKVSFADFFVAPGLAQRDIVLTTDRGTIEIGPGGLAGAFTNLELIAKQLRVDGPVTNTFTAAASGVRAILGDSTVRIDSAVSPLDNLTPWLTNASPGTANTGAVLLDITPLGSLTAGRVQIVVNDRGAGVRHAGAMLANAGDFLVSATGELRVSGGTMTAAQNAVIRVGRFVHENDAGNPARLIAANGGVLVETTGDASNIGSLVQGNARISGEPASAGAVTIRAGGGITNRTAPGGPTGVIFGVADDVELAAADHVTNIGGRVLGNRDVRLNAAGDILNTLELAGGVDGGTPRVSNGGGRNPFGVSKRTQTFVADYGTLAGSGEALVLAQGSVAMTGRNILNRGGEIDANGGDVRLAAQASVSNEAVGTGQARYEKSCYVFVCRASASTDVQVTGGFVNAGGSIEIAAGGEIANKGGRMLAVSDIVLSAPRVTASGIATYAAITRGKGLKAWFGDTWSQLYGSDAGGAITASLGRLRVNGTLYNEGGELAASGGVEASGGIVTVRPPRRDPVSIENHLGLTSWFWR